MKKLTLILTVAVLALTLVLPVTALAAQPDMGLKGLSGQAGKSNTAFVELWEKDSVWDIVEDGAWGKLKYNLEGATFDFVFNGHGLEPGTDYTLIYYGNEDCSDVWPWVTCLAAGAANQEGNIHLAGSFDLGYDLTSAKVWLVLSSDMDCGLGKMVAWQPGAYLFEYDVIDYDDTD